MAKKKAATKKTTRKKAAVKKAAKKKTSKKATPKKATKKTSGSSAALTADQQKKVRKLLKSKDAGNIKLAISLLETTDATKEDWKNVFSKTVISQLVKTWDVEIWSKLACIRDSSLTSIFESICQKHLGEISTTKRKSFLASTVSYIDPLLKTLLRGAFLNLRLPNAYSSTFEVRLSQTLSDHAAELLSLSDCKLRLRGVSSVTDAAAQSLSKHRGGLLGLDGLASLSDIAAESLSRHKGSLLLEEVTSLSDAAVDSFQKHKRGELYFQALACTDQQVAMLSRCKCRVNIFGPDPLRNITYTARNKAGVVSKCAFLHKGAFGGRKRVLASKDFESYNRISFESESISADEARMLLTCPGFIDVNVWRLSDLVAEILSSHDGGLAIECPRLSDAAAENLARTKGPLVTDMPNSNSRSAAANVISRYGASMLASHYDYVPLGRERDLINAII
ncbi:hypothetical protein OAF34_04270 [Pirellulaceae bacterium]|nr:hypothetical protein [Pirellulaceae bacterium]